MAKELKNKRRNYKKEKLLPFTRMNYILFGISLAVITIGFIALGQKPYNSFVSLSIAPILLVLGYVVLMPVAILYHKEGNSDSV